MKNKILALSAIGLLAGCGGSNSSNDNPDTPASACTMYGGSYGDSGEIDAFLVGNPDVIDSFPIAGELLPENSINAGDLCDQLGLSTNMMLTIDKVDEDIIRTVFEENGETGTLSWQGASDISLQDDFGTQVDEDILTQRPIGGGWNPDPISGKSVVPDPVSIGEWVVWIDDGEGAVKYPGYATQLEAIEFAGIDESKLLTTYELEEQWDELYSFWISNSEQSTYTFKSSFFGRSNKTLLTQ